MKKRCLIFALVALIFLYACSNPSVNSEVPKKCSLVTGRQEYDSCIKDVAFSEKNIQLCKNVTEKFRCQSEYWKKFPAPSLCEGIESGYTKDACYSDMATIFKDESFCEKVSDERRAGCYISISAVVNDSRICEKIVAVAKKDKCLMSFGMSMGNIEICNKVKDPSLLAQCTQSLTTNK